MKLFEVTEGLLEQLREKYDLTKYQPYGELHARKQALNKKRSSLGAQLEIEERRRQWSEAENQFLKLQIDSELDPKKEKAALAARKKAEKLKDELENNERLLQAVDTLIKEMQPEYEAAKQQAIYELTLEAKKEHASIVKKYYEAVRLLAEAQRDNELFRYSLGSAVGMIPSMIANLSWYGINGRDFLRQVGDEKLNGTPFYDWMRQIEDKGYKVR